MRVVQVANFVSPTSGGLRTALGHLADGYAGHGHEVVQVLPGPTDGEVPTPWGRQLTLRSVPLGRTGYRVLIDRARVRAVLEQLVPDVLEVHDRPTLRWLGRWARDRGVPSGSSGPTPFAGGRPPDRGSALDDHRPGRCPAYDLETTALRGWSGRAFTCGSAPVAAVTRRDPFTVTNAASNPTVASGSRRGSTPRPCPRCCG